MPRPHACIGLHAWEFRPDRAALARDVPPCCLRPHLWPRRCARDHFPQVILPRNTPILLPIDQSSLLAGSLVRGSTHGTRAGYLYCVFTVFVDAVTRILIAEYLRAVKKHATAPQMFPIAPLITCLVCATLLTVPPWYRTPTLCTVSALLPATSCPTFLRLHHSFIVTPQSVLAHWVQSRSAGFGSPEFLIITRWDAGLVTCSPDASSPQCSCWCY